MITGSYNWTYYAEKLNCENVIVIDDIPIVQKYTSEYSKLRDSFTKITRYEPLELKQITETDMLSDYNYLCNDLFLKGQKYVLLLPKWCVEHVVVHELCHLLEPSHNARFHALMDKYFPRWREARKETHKICKLEENEEDDDDQ